jgi:hypothetical protein
MKARQGWIVAVVLFAIVLVVWLARREERAPITNAPTEPTKGSSPILNAPNASPSAVTPVPSVAPKSIASAIPIPWGTSSGALGKKSPAEGNAEAPMSFAIAPDGVLWVIDQVNDRIVRIGKDGKIIDTIPLSVKGAQDITFAKDGTALVLDRLVDKRIAILDSNGKPVGSLTLEGTNLPEGGGATGVFVDKGSVYVEKEHEHLVRVGDTKGTADSERKEIPGRPTRDGTGYIRAWLGEIPGHRAFVTLTNKDPEAMRFTRQINTAMSTMGIVALDSDRNGIIYLGLLMTSVDGEGNPSGAPMLTMYCLESQHGAPIGQMTVPASSGPEETFREIAVLEEGGAIYMRRDEKGITMVPLDCRQ